MSHVKLLLKVKFSIGNYLKWKCRDFMKKVYQFFSEFGWAAAYTFWNEESYTQFLLPDEIVWKTRLEDTIFKNFARF